MPGSEAHALAGFAAGVVAIPACRRELTSDPSPFEIVIEVFSACLGARLPDLLEPADGPDHRGFFHSIVFGGLLAIVSLNAVLHLRRELEELEASFSWYRVNGRPVLPEDLSSYRILRWILCCVTGFSCGYVSHLVLDGMTPKSLPLLGL